MKSKLFVAAELGNISKYRTALAGGESINAINDAGETSLMIACAKGHFTLIQFIIAKGADVNVTTPKGLIAADYALRSENKEIVKLFGVTKNNTLSTNVSPFKRLIDNIEGIMEDIQLLLSGIEVSHRPYILEDFTKIMLLAIRGNEMNTLYKIAFAFLTHTIINKAEQEDFINSLKGLSEEEVITIFLELYENQAAFLKKMESYNYEFTLNSFPLFGENELDKLKKALYEFAEVVVKADGTVTKEETENLKTINTTFLGNINSGKGAIGKVF